MTLFAGPGELTIGLSLQLHRGLRGDLRQFREENSRRYGELAARMHALNARVDNLPAQS